MAKADSWPRMEQWYYRAGDVENKVKRLARVGLSYWLDDVLYAAWDIDANDAEGIRMARRGWLYVEFTTPHGIIIARVTDHGNSGASGRPVMDVSPAVYRAIKDYWPKNVSYRLVVLPE
jgi:hypothetical protein